MTDDVFGTSAGPYVLGALPPAERDAFEQHLSGCAPCTAAVAELAGLPGLLAQVSGSAVAALDAARSDDPAQQPPDTLLPGLLRAVRRRRRRGRWVAGGLGGLAAAAVAAAVVVSVTGARPLRAPALQPGQAGQPGPAVQAGQPMRLLVAAPLTATASLTGVAWGSRVEVDCRYRGPAAPADSSVAYVLVVTDRAGREQDLGTWAVVPGAPASVTGATSWRPADIRSIEIRTTTGTPLLRLME